MLSRSGKAFMNPAHARHADKMAGGSRPAPPKPAGGEPAAAKSPMSMNDGEEKDSIGSVTVHDHGDGTMHTEHEGGERVEHPSVSHMAAHLMAHHAPGAKHMAISHDGGPIQEHHADESGQVEGSDHENTDSLKDSMDQLLGEQGAEHPGGSDQGDEDGYGKDLEYGE